MSYTPEEKKRTKAVHVKMNQQEYEKGLQNMKSARYGAVSMYMRELFTGEVAPKAQRKKKEPLSDEVPADRKLIAEINRIGTNYNQTTRRFAALCQKTRKDGSPYFDQKALELRLERTETMFEELRALVEKKKPEKSEDKSDAARRRKEGANCRVSLKGWIVSEAQEKKSKTGASYIVFTLSCRDDIRKDSQEKTCFNVVCFNHPDPSYLKKGRLVSVEGYLVVHSRTTEDKTYTVLTVYSESREINQVKYNRQEE